MNTTLRIALTGALAWLLLCCSACRTARDFQADTLAMYESKLTDRLQRLASNKRLRSRVLCMVVDETHGLVFEIRANFVNAESPDVPKYGLLVYCSAQNALARERVVQCERMHDDITFTDARRQDDPPEAALLLATFGQDYHRLVEVSTSLLSGTKPIAVDVVYYRELGLPVKR